MRTTIPATTIALLILLALGAASLLIGCDAGVQAERNGQGPDQYPYQITCTTGMITDITRQVAGDKARVDGIMGEGVDPHTYKPSTSDMQQMERAEVVIYNGLYLEGKMQNILVGLSAKKPVFGVTKVIEPKYIMNETEGGPYDPHVWMDVQGWMRAVRGVRDQLIKYDKKHADYYQQQAEAYLQKLELLDQYVEQVIGSIPKKQRVLVTAHDAFNYFGRAYDIEVKGIQGLSTQSEASMKRINTLVDMLHEKRIGAVFVETSVAQKSVKALVEGARREHNHEVTIGGNLYSDAMGHPGTYEGTYIGMIDHNATTIARALGGEVPENGFRGWLAQNDHDIELAQTK